MKYTIETTKDGAMKTLEMSNGEIYTSEVKKTFFGCETQNVLSKQLEEAGYCEELVEGVDDLFDGFLTSDFIDLSDLEG